jgi:hypothetical protein
MKKNRTCIVEGTNKNALINHLIKSIRQAILHSINRLKYLAGRLWSAAGA